MPVYSVQSCDPCKANRSGDRRVAPLLLATAAAAAAAAAAV